MCNYYVLTMKKNSYQLNVCQRLLSLMCAYFVCFLIFEEFQRILISNSFLNWSKIDLLSGRADFISRKHVVRAVVTAVRYQNKLWYVITDSDSNVTMGAKPFKIILQFLFTNLILQFTIGYEKKVKKCHLKIKEGM